MRVALSELILRCGSFQNVHCLKVCVYVREILSSASDEIERARFSMCHRHVRVALSTLGAQTQQATDDVRAKKVTKRGTGGWGSSVNECCFSMLPDPTEETVGG